MEDKEIDYLFSYHGCDKGFGFFVVDYGERKPSTLLVEGLTAPGK